MKVKNLLVVAFGLDLSTLVRHDGRPTPLRREMRVTKASEILTS